MNVELQPQLILKTYLPENEFPKRDLINIEPGVSLPEGMTTEDIQDALNWARAFEGQTIRYAVYIREKLERNGVVLGGIAYGSSGFIELSVAAARYNAAAPSPISGYYPAPARQQMWAIAFEEALHAVRMAAGKDQDPYFLLPANPTIIDELAYLLQDREAVVDEVLNSGVLEAKFGRGTIFFCKAVLRKTPVFDNNLIDNNLPILKIYRPEPNNSILKLDWSYFLR